jgi:alkane 1-monooxygenase
MVVGCVTGELWLFRVVAWVWLIVAVLDLAVRPDTRNLHGERVDESRRAGPWRLAVRLWVPVQATIIVCGLFITTWNSATVKELLFVTVSIGIAGGMFCIPVAHELMHGTGRFDKLLAEILMTLVSYTHFCIGHVNGHHRNVGTANDPATARFGESFYAFYPRTVFGGLASAWHLEQARLHRLGAGVWSSRNRMVRYFIGLSAVYTAIFCIFGLPGVAFFTLQSVIAFSMIEVINYVEHYGLVRNEAAPGRFERVMAWHSWNSSHRISNWLLFNLGRHSDHHQHPRTSYPYLRHREEAPQLPSGYFGMFLLPLFPSLWRLVMDHRVEAWRREHGVS